ncbi:MAG: hypothetical protein EHM20_08555 [Alphaproteobacteria bacterium]|nr:MAG: hypothetical protein EHM20_08555 [Alphaproteobacteria bacterium]
MDTKSLLTESGRAKSSKVSDLTNVLKRERAALPSSLFLAIAAGAVALSLGLAVSKKEKNWASFVGQWVPTILLLGIYDKIVTSGASKHEDSKSNLLH